MRTIAITVAWLTLLGCASAHAPTYDGEFGTPALADSGVTYVRLTIRNDRTKAVPDPTFYLLGTGRHSLGVVGGLRNEWVDTRWFGPQGCMRIVAHYPGGRDLAFDRFCWHRGEVIDVTLESDFNPAAAWSHR